MGKLRKENVPLTACNTKTNSNKVATKHGMVTVETTRSTKGTKDIVAVKVKKR